MLAATCRATRAFCRLQAAIRCYADEPPPLLLRSPRDATPPSSPMLATPPLML